MPAGAREDWRVDPALCGVLEVAQTVPGGPGGDPGGGDDEGDAVTVPPRLLPGRSLGLRLGPGPGGRPGRSPGETGRHSIIKPILGGDRGICGWLIVKMVSNAWELSGPCRQETIIKSRFFIVHN